MGFGNRYNYFRDERYDGSPHRMSPEQRVRDDINGFQLVRTAGGGNGADDAFFLDGVRARVEQLPESDFKRSAQEFVARAEQIVRAETIEDLADPRDYLSRTSHAHTDEMRSAVDAFNDAVEHAASPSEGQAPVLDRDAATSAAGQDASASQTISSTDADPLGKAFSSPELTDDGARPDWPRLDPDPADPGSPSVADSQSQPDDGSDDGRAVAMNSDDTAERCDDDAWTARDEQSRESLDQAARDDVDFDVDMPPKDDDPYEMLSSGSG